MSLNFNEYFNDEEDTYYDSRIIRDILESVLNKSMDEIKEEIDNCAVTLSEKEIKEFLDKTLLEENPELSKRVNSPRKKISSNVLEWTEEDKKNIVQEFSDNLSLSRYSFDPYTLKYFEKYISILRNKILLLLTIESFLSRKDSYPIEDYLDEFDISIDENINILKSDIIRLITPTVYNIEKIRQMTTKANNLETYLEFGISKDSLYKHGSSERDLFPSKKLQIKDSRNDYMKGNIELTERQREKIRDSENEDIKYFVKLLLDSD